MQHAVAVGADQGEVGQLGCGVSGQGEGQYVVGLNEPGAERAVRGGEVEAADLAGQCTLPG